MRRKKNQRAADSDRPRKENVMSFLSCNPMVSVIGNEYEILCFADANGIFKLSIGGDVYYEDNCGALPSEKRYAKIRVPQVALDKAKSYTIIYKKTINRKGYFSEFEEEQSAEFAFRPLEKTDDIKMYHVADVHYHFETALKTTSWFGSELDLLIVNGDIGEVETEQNFFEVGKFVGDVTGGNIPVIFVRGNHDTRGHLAERYPDYFPVVGKNTYYTFEIGPFRGIALDCGEDKWDNHAEYGGANAFEPFRKRETEFLRSLEPSNKLTFAISHVCPAKTADSVDSIFNIDSELYEEWNANLARLRVKFMICGHFHRAYIMKKNDERALRAHEYPVIVGSAVYENELWGAAITYKGGKLNIKFTDNNLRIREENELDIESGEITQISAQE